MPDTARKVSALREPPPATLPPRPSRFKSWREWLGAVHNWLHDTFSRDRVVSFLKTLVWVAPLTLLIWIYAEREQVSSKENEVIPFELVSSDATRIATLKGGDRNLLVDLQGPRARLEVVLEKLRGGSFPQGIQIKVDPALTPNAEHDVLTKPLLEREAIFRDNGITVQRVQPSRLRVTVDRQIEVDARVVAPSDVTNLLPATSFIPATVKVRGPEALLKKGGQPVVYALIAGMDALKTPGEKRVAGIPIELPAELRDERVAVVPNEVEATLHVRQSDDQYTYDSITVQAIVPRGLETRYTLEYSASLANVTVVGPKEQIDQLRRTGDKPLAVFRVTDKDAIKDPSDKRTRAVEYLSRGLPPDVRVSPKDEGRTVDFQLLPRAAADQ